MQTKKAITQKGLTKIITVLRHTGRPFYEEDEVVFEGLGGLVPTEDSWTLHGPGLILRLSHFMCDLTIPNHTFFKELWKKYNIEKKQI